MTAGKIKEKIGAFIRHPRMREVAVSVAIEVIIMIITKRPKPPVWKFW